MNVERLHAICVAIRKDLEETQTVQTLNELVAALQGVVSQPGQPAYQEQVAAALGKLTTSLESSQTERFPATWRQTLEQLDIDSLLGEALLVRVQSILARNQITPTVAQSEIAALTTEVTEMSNAIDQLLAGLEYFHVGTEDLPPGEVEVAVLIPRPAVNNDLPHLGKEFLELQRLMGPFLELATGSRPDLKVNAIASTDFGVFLNVDPQSGALIALAVERVVALYKSLLEIRRLRQEIADHGVPTEKLTGVEDYANSLMGSGIDEHVETLIQANPGPVVGRDHELKMELRLSLNGIANRIDRGYNIDVRVSEPDEVDEAEGGGDDDSAAIRTIVNASPNLKFINPSGHPMLSLPEGREKDDVAGGDPTIEEGSA